MVLTQGVHDSQCSLCFGAAASALRAVYGVSLFLHALISDPWVRLVLIFCARSQ